MEDDEDDINCDETVTDNGTDVKEKIQEPKVGILFTSANELFECYKEYRRENGFPVIKRTSSKGDDGKLRYVTYACARSVNALKPHPSKKNNSKAQVRADEDCRLRNVFWTNAKSMTAYEEFGDIVTFDTTYLTNLCDMPIVPFVGP
ncbi:hypothetical protein Dsin_005007 [Dipteronia sinensis]|uniref:Protein FAR1-RELATED SEQUENCE n=1 Tax=Dipteronia sinensis TaxID=43782 RepID=A0AAE0EG33_9ROSI|nr:hypothetical protein Dsin_005007 [Dipteronia sinensis]